MRLSIEFIGSLTSILQERDRDGVFFVLWEIFPVDCFSIRRPCEIKTITIAPVTRSMIPDKRPPAINVNAVPRINVIVLACAVLGPDTESIVNDLMSSIVSSGYQAKSPVKQLYLGARTNVVANAAGKAQAMSEIYLKKCIVEVERSVQGFVLDLPTRLQERICFLYHDLFILG